MADRQYVGTGSGLASAIERFNGCTNVEQRNTNGAALQLDEITKEYDKRIEQLTNMVHAGRDSGRDGGRQRQPRPDHALHIPPMPTIPPPMPPPMPPPHQPPFMPNLQMPPPYHFQPQWAPPAGPLAAAPIPAPYAFQQPGLGPRHDGQRAVPPHVDQAAQTKVVVRSASDFRVRGLPTSLQNSFALSFGENVRTVTRGSDPHIKRNWATICASIKWMTHKGACPKWLAFGMCRDPNCDKLHDNWPMHFNGEVLNSKYRDVAIIARVPQNWQPRASGRH